MRVETVALETIDGVRLEGDLSLPGRFAPGVVVAHPHPRFGGDRRNAVVGALFSAFAEAGAAVLRFDFRGAGGSEGVHDGGVAERLDVAAAVELLEPYAGDHPLLVAGYSFGALVALDVADSRIAGWVAVAPPLAPGEREPVAATDHRPKHLLVPEHDQLAPPGVIEERTAGWLATTVEVVPMADHFLAGRTATVAVAAVAALHRLTGRDAP